jgi:hypothetical protein
MRALSGRALCKVSAAALALAVWLADPMLAAASSLLTVGAFHAVIARSARQSSVALALDCIALGVFAWAAALTITLLVADAWLNPPSAQEGASLFSLLGLLALVATFAILRLGRSGGHLAEGAIVLLACVPVAAPAASALPLRLALCSMAALYLAWHGWILLGPVTSSLLRAGRR